jgi:hypothetical protein
MKRDGSKPKAEGSGRELAYRITAAGLAAMKYRFASTTVSTSRVGDARFETGLSRER